MEASLRVLSYRTLAACTFSFLEHCRLWLNSFNEGWCTDCVSGKKMLRQKGKHEITHRNSSLELLSPWEVVRFGVWVWARNTKGGRKQHQCFLKFLILCLWATLTGRLPLILWESSTMENNITIDFLFIDMEFLPCVYVCVCVCFSRGILIADEAATCTLSHYTHAHLSVCCMRGQLSSNITLMVFHDSASKCISFCISLRQLCSPKKTHLYISIVLLKNIRFFLNFIHEIWNGKCVTSQRSWYIQTHSHWCALG